MIFPCTFEGEGLKWFNSCSQGKISSFAGFIEAFRKKWDPSYAYHMVHDFSDPKEKKDEQENEDFNAASYD